MKRFLAELLVFAILAAVFTPLTHFVYFEAEAGDLWSWWDALGGAVGAVVLRVGGEMGFWLLAALAE